MLAPVGRHAKKPCFSSAKRQYLNKASMENIHVDGRIRLVIFGLELEAGD